MVFALASLEKPYAADFLACEVPSSGCRLVAGGIELDRDGLALPVGDPMDS